MSKLLKSVQLEPALVGYVLSTAAALVAAYFSHVTKGQEAAIVTIGTALAAIYTAAMARPVQVPVITGAVSTVLAASAAYGLHLMPAQSATAVAGLSVVLSLLLRQHLTPVKAPVIPAGMVVASPPRSAK
jgi:hypothetical protein